MSEKPKELEEHSAKIFELGCMERPVYLKEDVDAVIAVLKQKLQDQCISCPVKMQEDDVVAEKDAKILALEAEVFKQKHHAKLFFDERNYAETQLRHQKYKRCLAKAEMCGNAYDKWMMKKANAIGLGKDGVAYYLEARLKVSHYMRWHKRWLKIAEQFKEAK